MCSNKILEFQISLSLLVACWARPEGYSYPVPAGPTLSLPGPSIGGSHGISSIGSSSQLGVSTLGTSHLGVSSLGSSHGISSIEGVSSLGSSHGISSFSGSSLSSGQDISQISLTTSGGGALFSGGGGGSFSAGGGGSSFTSSLGNFGSGSTLVQKHIYVHVPPPEPEDLRPQRILPVAPAQKHYKIIFIKAPSPPAPTLPAIPVQPQNEEKTLVYVLVKKPEEAPELNIPAPAPTQPSKPEVYFIRYKTQKDHSGVSLASGAAGGATLVDDSAAALAGSGSVSSSFSSAHGSSSASSFISSSSGGLTSSYGPPGHVPGPY